ncbi:MAG: trehalase-like domain-containing protein, partial [Acidimicrobiales bacterium]
MTKGKENTRVARPPREPLPHVLREYALIADGERGAVIGPRGDLVWMCAPAWHDEGVFSSLIGGGGSYELAPADPRYVWGGYYEPGTLIFRSRFVTDSGLVECREALAFPGEGRRAVVLRRVIALDCAASMQVMLDPRAGFGRYAMRELSCRKGIWTSRSGSLRIRWQGGADAQAVASRERGRGGGGLLATVLVKPGDTHDFVLEIA